MSPNRAKLSRAAKPVRTSRKHAMQLGEIAALQRELETKNDKLCVTEAELAVFRSKYAELYELAPVGYFITDTRGHVLALNQRATMQLGAARSLLLHRPFLHLVTPQYRYAYQAFLEEVAATRASRSCDIEIVRPDHSRFFARLEGVPQIDENNNVHRIFIAFIDTTEQKRTLDTLARVTARFEAMFTSMSSAVVLTDLNQMISMINPAAERLFGYTFEELRARPAAQLYAGPADYADFGQPAGDGRASSLREIVDLRCRRKDGSVFDAERIVSPVRDGRGRVLGLIGIHRDITERKRAEETLRESRQLYSLLFSKSAFAASLIKLSEKVFIDVNESFETVFGYPRHEAIGRTPGDLGIITPEEDWTSFQALEQQGGQRGAEIHARTKTGEERVIVINHNMFAFEEEIYVLSTMHDITERKQAEEALRQSEAQFRAFFHTAAVGTAQIDLHGRFLMVNEQFGRITGYTREELFSMTVEDLTHPDDRFLDAGIRERFFAGALPSYDVEKRYLRKDGTVAWVHVSAAQVRDADGKSLYSTGIVQDITKRKRAEEALKEQMQLVSLANDAIIIRDVATDTITYWNEGAVHKYGWSRDEALGKSTHALLKTRFPEPLEEIREVLLADGTWKGELYHTCRDGKIICVLSRWTLQKEGGRPKSYIEINTDITDRKQIEEALRESEEQFRILTEKSPDFIALHDKELRHLYVNPAIGKQNGLPQEAFVGKTTLEMGMPIDFANKVDRLLRQTVVTGREQVDELTFPSAEGPRYLQWRSVPLFEREGSVKAIMTVSNDITDRKRAEEMLMRSNELLEEHVWRRTAQLKDSFTRLVSVFESMRDGFFAVDFEWNLTYVNSEATRIWGIASQDLIGRSFWDITPGARGTIFEDQFRKVFAEHVPVTFEALLPGSKRWVEVRAYPSQENLAVYFHDITARREAEEERRRLASAVEAAGEAIVISDRYGNIQYVNPAFEQVTGYSRAEAQGKTVHLLTSGMHDAAFYKGIIESLRRSGVWRGRMTSRKKDGTLYFEDCIISAVKDEAGETMNFVSIRRDETEKLRLESIAMAVNSMENIGYVFAGVRHEIGNPINNAKMALSVLEYQLESASKETVAQYVQRALSEIGRVERLLMSLKSYNLYETLHPETLLTSRLLDELYSLLSRDLNTRKIELTFRIEKGAERIVADSRALVQVLLNLLTNSIDALNGREDGRIELAAAAEGLLVHLRIIDNGCGITPAGQRSLFRPFFTTKPNGTGLGLMIVKKMLLRMNGQIEIRSTAGVGTEADISLQRG